MTLEDEIAEAQTYMVEPPKNESNTCEWIILPLLWAAGYAKRDIESRVADSAGKFPDYTLLPNYSSATFYLEAKAWNEPLHDNHVSQSLDYANRNGKCFVVLTNGQSWRLYDNSVRGLPADKLMTQATLQDTRQITAFLSALSKPEVLQGSLERVAEVARQRKLQEDQDRQERQQREAELQSIRKRQIELRSVLDATLPDFLRDSRGDLVVLMTKHLSDKDEFKDISPETLALWFSENLPQHWAEREEPADEPSSTLILQLPYIKNQGGRTLTLTELQGKPIDGKVSRPIALKTPDGTPVVVRSWVQLAEQAVRWFLQQTRPLPLPFESSHRTRWFLNRVPEHKHSDQRKKFKEVSTHGRTIYMDSDRPGEMFLKDIHALCQAMQIDPSGFQITMYP